MSGFLVEVALADLEALRRQYPEAFNKPYSGQGGLKFERVLVNDSGGSKEKAG